MYSDVIGTFQRRGMGIHTLNSSGDVTPLEAPQDNLGAYTLKAGDTLEIIALQVYGDSSLWYLLADANGISDKNAKAGGQLHIGQRLNIPSVAAGQHHTNSTHKVLNGTQMLGNTSATNPLPQRHQHYLKNTTVFFQK